MLTERTAACAPKVDAGDSQLSGALGIRENTLTDDPRLASPLNAEAARLRALRSEPVVLRLRHISKSYPIAGTDDRVEALKDITLTEPDSPSEGHTVVTNTASSEDSLPPPFGPVRRGEFVMIRGPSGGGKTTLLNIVGTIDACTNGTIEVNGRNIDKDTTENVLADIRLKSLGFVFQTFNLIATMTAAENVELPMTLLGKLSNKEIRLRSRQLLTLVGLRNRINHLPSELSGGEQQRVTIARSLANNPSLLLLDEPTGDLDTANTIEIMDLLLRINRRTKTTCIMVTHNPDIECYADRILYVNDGRFAKEVYNTVPTCLNLEKYAKYLTEKEKLITGLTHINENATSDAEDAETVEAGGAAMVRLRLDPCGNSPVVGSVQGPGANPLRLHNGGNDSLNEKDIGEAPLLPPSPATSGFGSLRAGENVSSPVPAQTNAAGGLAPPNSSAPPGRWRNGLQSAAAAAVPPSRPSPLTPVVHREEKEAEEGM
ncbi:putative ATP-binding cassette protein subfamily H member 2 [Leptomonas pyrrhocoris]|uniref:Putative ATP-binding cassette protein subfamily H member 2 n=1 Tax=Leptomonas pyrrhocoris TaxID=157538 RepID=A0A0N0DVM2_LEPPY|nr:putative ATP-binding cassette protein subfamily H member 2 [Leptomonas pyrrhocoris]KPA80542.1 putative ATP-binding cassette protein subfamily H member 2 [Leptomonas pyrrhocoris]|eukprot:XP_015658981.1 putative ATP-binding cassette protein subfamily H member 2 [Leptomonas pyrrhocoris]